MLNVLLQVVGVLGVTGVLAAMWANFVEGLVA